MTVNDWITQNYQNILQWAKNAAQQHDDYEDLAHYAITTFLEHEKAQQLVYNDEARWFIVRILLNSSRGTKSEYYRIYRPQHDTTAEFKQIADNEYNMHLDFLTEHVYGILEDMIHGDAELWFMGTLTTLCLQQDKINFSKLARETGIPRTTISDTYKKTLEYIKNKLHTYGNNNTDLRNSINDYFGTTD
jgi:hypothetical protein